MATKLASSTIGVLLMGTGTMYPIETAPLWQPFVQSRIQLGFEKTNHSHPHMDLRTPIEHLQNIRTILNPSMAELAGFFDVSRQAIYKWLAEGSFPEADKLTRIIELSKIADAFKEAGIQRGSALLNMKLFEEQSLFDLLKARKPHEKQVRELIAEAKMMEAAYQQSGLAESNTKPTNDWLSSVSIPAHREE
jgi:transcriptional regulator with XRE-family HTH domain